MNSVAFVWSVYLGVAFVAGLGLIAGLLIALQLQKRLGSFTIGVTFCALMAGLALSSALSGRDLKYASLGVVFDTGSGNQWLSTWGLRLISISVVLLAAARVIHLFGRSAGADRVRQIHPLVIAFGMFFLSNSALNAIFGTIPQFDHKIFYPLLIFIAVSLSGSADALKAIQLTKAGLLTLLAASCIVAIALPRLAIQPGYAGWIPGIDFRFWGLGSHANSIGPFAVALLLLEASFPSKQRTTQTASILIALVVLMLSQSKTAWIAAATLLPIIAWYRVRRSAGASGGGMALASLGLLFVLLTAVFAAGLLIVEPKLISNYLFRADTAEQLSGLSGRDTIWEFAIAEWKRNPLFGYGPTIWSLEHRMSLGALYASSAHNQFFQSLSASGSVGVVGLVIYTVVLGWFALKSASATHGASLAFFGLLLIRGITETPMTLGTLFGVDVILHGIALMLCAAFSQPSQDMKVQPSRSTTGFSPVGV